MIMRLINFAFYNKIKRYHVVQIITLVNWVMISTIQKSSMFCHKCN